MKLNVVINTILNNSLRLINGLHINAKIIITGNVYVNWTNKYFIILSPDTPTEKHKQILIYYNVQEFEFKFTYFKIVIIMIFNIST